MSIIKMIRYTRGVVHFEIHSGFIERFINLCAQGGVPIWDGRKKAGRYCACTTVAGSRRLPELAAKAGVTLEMGNKSGLPPMLKRYRKRTGLFAGLLVLLAAVLVLGNFIWQIDITGLETIPREEVEAVLTELGVHPGVLRRSIDARDVERQVMIRIDKVGWIAVNLRGSIAQVEVKERVLPPALIDDTVPHNVVADSAGYITYMEVYDGQSVVSVGDSVSAGDILVSGIMEDSTGKDRIVHARARILAQTEEILTVTIPFEQESYNLISVEKRHRLELFSIKIPLSLGGTPEEPYKHESAAYDVPLLSALMPLSYHKDYYFVLECTTRTITSEQAMELALAELTRQERIRFAQAEIIQKDAQGEEISGSFVLTVRYLCQRDISQELEIDTASLNLTGVE